MRPASVELGSVGAYPGAQEPVSENIRNSRMILVWDRFDLVAKTLWLTRVSATLITTVALGIKQNPDDAALLSGQIMISMVESLTWVYSISISDNAVDQYESNLMRRVCGLIYFPDKLSAEIKLKLINNK